jgi:hypothetical protein
VTKDSRTRLDRVLDAIEQSFASATDQDLRDDICAEGGDPTAVEHNVRSVLGGVLKGHRQEKLRAAQAGYRDAVDRFQQRPARIPAGPTAQRALLARAVASGSQMTAQFRDLDHLSPEDIASALQQLDALGLLPDTDGEGE